jgi:transposase
MDMAQTVPETVLVAGDEASLYLQATTMRVWHPCGQRPVIHVSPNRASTHYYGALNLQTGRETVMRSSVMNGATTVLFLLMLLATYPTQPILLLWDRAPWHRSKLVKTFLQAHPRLEILWLPPASPELNPQEHVWKATRAAVSHNHAISKLDLLADAFEAHLRTTAFPCSLLDLHNYSYLCMLFK